MYLIQASFDVDAMYVNYDNVYVYKTDVYVLAVTWHPAQSSDVWKQIC